MDIPKEQITSFMLTMGLTQDQASQIHERAQRDNYTEELLNALYPDNVFLPGSTAYSAFVNNYLCVQKNLPVPCSCFFQCLTGLFAKLT